MRMPVVPFNRCCGYWSVAASLPRSLDLFNQEKRDGCNRRCCGGNGEPWVASTREHQEDDKRAKGEDQRPPSKSAPPGHGGEDESQGEGNAGSAGKIIECHCNSPLQSGRRQRINKTNRANRERLRASEMCPQASQKAALPR